MAVAVQPSPETRKPAQPMGLVGASLIGTVFVLAAAALVLQGVPWLWEKVAQSLGIHDLLVRMFVQITAQVAVAIGLIYLASRLHGDRPPTGVRGGIFFMIIVAVTAFFCVKGLADVATQGFTFPGLLLMLLLAFILFLVVQFFRTGRFTEWSMALDQGGWFDTHNYKKTQGLRVRRLTILGILLITGSGVMTLISHNWLPENTTVKFPDATEKSNRLGDWVVGGTYMPVLEVQKNATDAQKEEVRLENRSRPRIEGGVTLLPDLKYTIPLILIAASLWFAWRVVNYPTFADFLIATEAEINKVSWTSRRALVRDTIVVLTSLVLITLFLFVVDMFWGWLLSQSWIGVLPTKEEQAIHGKGTDSKPVTDW
jgi:preprotein translocase SecE subunit